MTKFLKRLFSPEPHLYTIYNENEKRYFGEDYHSRNDALVALQQYLTVNNVSIIFKDELTHCKQYVCDNGQTFYINREY